MASLLYLDVEMRSVVEEGGRCGVIADDGIKLIKRAAGQARLFTQARRTCMRFVGSRAVGLHG